MPREKPASERRDHDLRIPVTDDEAMRLRQWSEREGKPLSQLIRPLLFTPSRAGR